MAVCDLSTSEISWDESMVPFFLGGQRRDPVLHSKLLDYLEFQRRKRRKCTLVNANSGRRSKVPECLFDRLDVRQILLHLC
jgi:hypothetical protein